MMDESGRPTAAGAHAFTDWLAGRLIAAAEDVEDGFPEAAQRFRAMALCAMGGSCEGRCELAAPAPRRACHLVPEGARPAVAA